MPIIKPQIVAPAAPQQHGQPSRKGKKAWRKNVDVSDVQKGLDVVRDEIIQGGIIAEKESTDLFILDTTGDTAISKKFLKDSKPLKADEIIAQRSAVPAVSLRKRFGDKTIDGVVEQKRQRVSCVSNKELNRLRNISNGHRDMGEVLQVTDPTYDPWDVERELLAQVQDSRFSFLPKPRKKVAPKTLQHKSISLAASGKVIPAVQKPEGGYSYNPSHDDYEKRLKLEGEREVAAEKRRLATEEAERLRLEAVAQSAAEAAAAETKGDVSEWEEDSAWEGFESRTEELSLNAKRPERKTQPQRNRMKRRKEEEQKAKMAADIRKKNEQVSQVKKIAKALAAGQEARVLAVHDSEISSDGDDLELRRRKLGKISLPEKQLELMLPDELQESLRLLKPEGNLLKDRYRSFLVRGKVESRRPISFAKKAKRKATEKWTHKDFMLY